MNFTQWCLVAWIAVSAVAVFVRGMAGAERTYDKRDAIWGVIECSIAIWMVVSL